MKLRISRSQKSSGLVTKHVIFCIDARAELTPEEAANVKKYKLGKEVIYNSQRAKEYLEKAQRNFSTYSGSFLAGMVNMAMANVARSRIVP
jgi:hypothetical protein